MARRQDIECARVLGALAIVWFHAQAPGYEAAYSGLVVFLFLTSYLAAGSGNPANRTVGKRALRLLVPWGIWFAVYALMNLKQHRPFVPLENGPIAGLATGPAVHLWYLPFTFAFLVLLDQLRARVSPKALAAGAGAVVVGMLATTPLWRPWSIAVGEPVAQYLHALPGLCLGVFFADFGALPRRLGIAIAVAATVAAASAAGYPGVGLPYLVGIAAALVLTFLPRGESPIPGIAALAPYTFGIYLIHPLLLRQAQRLPSLPGPLVPLIVFGLALAVVAAIKRLVPKAARYCV